jgi:hypothetical protein
MSLMQYWPSEEETDRCIKTEAETASEAVLLAVHQETPLSRRHVGASANERESVNEQDLIEHFTSENVPSGTMILPITGGSGVGKSHLLRWLDASIRQSANADRYAVIRIPKSASLRQVVQLILEQLKGDAYSQVREEFLSAVAEVSPEEAVVRFRGELEISLGNLANFLKQQLHERKTDGVLKQKLLHALRFPYLLRDDAFVDVLQRKVLPRIIDRSVSGRSPDDSAIGDTYGDDDGHAKFTDQDLKLLDQVDLTEASRNAQLYYQQALRANDGAGREVAVDVLNSVVDEAVQRLFQLQHARGGMTFEEVILEIRRQLLDEGRELVLLVEDFVLLVGIQDTLARVMSAEGVKDGKQQLATMRSAIAVTEGYLTNRETLLTRAHYEWFVESRLPDRENVLSRVKSMTAAYLNAARWGAEAIEIRYPRAESLQIPRHEWLPGFEAELDEADQKKLEAFGQVNQIPLFPFSETAIEYLADQALKENEQLIFNPRYVINSILRSVLRIGRGYYEQNQFPPKSLAKRQLRGQVAQWLAGLSHPDPVRGRMATILLVWGNDPQNLVDIANIPPAVFEAFNLPVPDVTEEVELEARPTPSAEVKAKETTTVVGSAHDPIQERIEEYSHTLEEWVNGTEMPQRLARELRAQLAKSLMTRIDKNAEFISSKAIDHNNISIPNTRGGGRVSSTEYIQIADDSSDSDGRVRMALLGLLRLCEYEKEDNYNYAGRDDDLVVVSAFLENLLPQAKQILRERSDRAFKALLWSWLSLSRVLGVAPSRTNARSLTKALSEKPSLRNLRRDAPRFFLDWHEFQTKAKSLRSDLSKELFDYCGCFQGTGKTPRGIDFSRLLDGCLEEPEDSRLVYDIPTTSELSLELKKIRGQHLRTKVKGVVRAARQIDDDVVTIMGEHDNKDETVRVMKELADLFVSNGEWPAKLGPTATPYRKLVDEFRVAPVFAAQDSLRAFGEDEITGAPEQVQRVGQIALDALIVARDFATQSNQLIDEVERHIRVKSAEIGGSDPEQAWQEVAEELDRVDRCLSEFVAEEEA